ncbi:type VI secretion system protein ImpL [Pseudoduganella flava]|uniref:Type VI secretion system protein ImpL n=1 Tax=Pseudoduganella flava TaxID=871742 RepID=A0A562PHB0_9BURK|nr:type VI secretion system protein [Pseudoduganella flava]QGZ42666.1 hypothetical protein GO485_28965 [Pseudoduganella flava]TWI43831.1 type VI secretion system protein ImpL [Pseudoduganella flava]
MLNDLADNVAIATLLLVTLLVALLLGLVVAAALRGTGQAPLGADTLRRSFRRAVKLIEGNLAARAERYTLPWALLLNDSAARPLPLGQAGIPSALGTDSAATAAGHGIDWHFFDAGVVVQLQGEHLGAPDARGGVWDHLLGLCRGYRPQRPIDSIVLAVPAAALLAAGPEEQAVLTARAQALHRRLWLAQNRLALRIPVYLIVTECDTLPGFAAFGAALPDALCRSMLGWSAPFELVAPFRAQWVDEAVDEIVGAAADRCAELCALEPAGADSATYFMLPGELERLRAGLKLFCEELMRPSAYHEPFLLRGVYLTGDRGASAALLAGTVQPPGASELVPAAMDRMPVFLRDVFERKIFAEVGLVQSSSQRLRRPAATRAVHWAALAVPAVWAVGLVVATVRLNHLGDSLTGSLQALNRDTRASLRAGQGGGLDAQRGQQRATDALQNIERLGSAHFSSVFMPGSWPVFDDLHQRVVRRLEQGFADNAFEPLRRAAFLRVSRLTGVPVDSATGALIGGAQCSLPAGWREQTGLPAPAALNLEDLPQYRATLAYLGKLDELDRVLAAMLRLKRAESGRPAGADLALVVRVLLGTELTGGAPARTAAVFRTVAQREPSLALEPLQAASRCALRRAGEAMYERLFDGNGLLASERTLGTSLAALADGSAFETSLAGHLQVWHTVRDTLDLQQSQLAGGKGAWMHQDVLTLGPGYDALLGRIGANALLGKPAVLEHQRLAADGFGRFAVLWNAALSAPGPLAGTGSGAGLVWTGAGWAFSAERKALHEAVAGLVAQPFMTAPPESAFATAGNGTVGWDKALLEQALHLPDARRTFLAGPYAKLPAALQHPAGVLADEALAATAQSLLTRALNVVPVELPGSGDGERAAVLRVRAWLQEIGADHVTAELDAVLARDAVARLLRLDEAFAAADVFVPRDRAFGTWKGEKGALLDAFGAGDAAALGAYVAQQQEFVDTVAREAEAVLAQLARVAAGHPVAARWQAIVADVRRYRLKSPASSLMALEQFIVGPGADLDLGNCTEKLTARAAWRRGGDVFAERLSALQTGLLARCRELSASRYRSEWERFAEVYNRDLAQHAPFAAVPGSAAAPADRDTVGAALKQFDRARAAGAQADGGAAGIAVRDAGEQLRRIRDVLAPLYPADPGQAAGLDVTVQFRAAGQGEAGANQIIDWSLVIGPATVRLGEPVRALRWEPGMPVLLALRFARDGAGVPRADAAQAHMTVAERAVTYRFDDPWALFSFIGAQRDADTPGDPRAALLRFEFPVQQAAAAVRARVFVRLAVSAPGKQAPLAWPTVYPARVPLWQESANQLTTAAQ